MQEMFLAWRNALNEFQNSMWIAPAPLAVICMPFDNILLDRHLIKGSLWAGFFPTYVIHIREFLTDLSHQIVPRGLHLKCE